MEIHLYEVSMGSHNKKRDSDALNETRKETQKWGLTMMERDSQRIRQRYEDTHTLYSERSESDSMFTLIL